jgi:hypothetical protein
MTIKKTGLMASIDAMGKGRGAKGMGLNKASSESLGKKH